MGLLMDQRANKYIRSFTNAVHCGYTLVDMSPLLEQKWWMAPVLSIQDCNRNSHKGNECLCQHNCHVNMFNTNIQ